MSDNKVNKCLDFNSRDLRASLLSVAIIPNPFILDVSWYWIKSIQIDSSNKPVFGEERFQIRCPRTGTSP